MPDNHKRLLFYSALGSAIFRQMCYSLMSTIYGAARNAVLSNEKATKDKIE